MGSRKVKAHKLNKSQKKRTVKFKKKSGTQKLKKKNADNFNLEIRLTEKLKLALKLNGT